jgi:hypothetical protein
MVLTGAYSTIKKVRSRINEPETIEND